jgi:hypothetical protein
MIAFIIPIYPKDFKYLYGIKEKISILSKIFDFYLVFSSQEDLDLFEDKKLYKCLIKSHSKINIAGQKKFYALNKLKNEAKYDYFMIVDAEIDVVLDNFTHENIISKIESYYNNKKIYAGDTSNKRNIVRINKNTRDILGDKISNYISENVGDSLYYWWSDLSVVKREHIEHFLNLIGYYQPKFALNNDQFDVNIYINFLIYHHGFEVINLTKSYSEFKKLNFSLEEFRKLDMNALIKLKEIGYGFGSIRNNMFEMFKEFYISNGTFLLYHTDRPGGQKRI